MKFDLMVSVRTVVSLHHTCAQFTQTYKYMICVFINILKRIFARLI